MLRVASLEVTTRMEIMKGAASLTMAPPHHSLTRGNAHIEYRQGHCRRSIPSHGVHAEHKPFHGHRYGHDGNEEDDSRKISCFLKALGKEKKLCEALKRSILVTFQVYKFTAMQFRLKNLKMANLFLYALDGFAILFILCQKKESHL